MRACSGSVVSGAIVTIFFIFIINTIFFIVFLRVINKLDLLSEGYIDNYLPKPLASRTLYAKFGDRVFFIFLLILFLFIGIRKKLLGNKFEKY